MTPEPSLSPEQIVERLQHIDARLDKGATRMTDIERELKDNTAATLSGNSDVKEILDLFQTIKGGIKVLGWIGAAVRWLVPIVAPLVALYGAYYAATHNGQLPK